MLSVLIIWGRGVQVEKHDAIFVSAVPGELRRHASTRWKLPLLLQTKDYDLNHMGEKKEKRLHNSRCCFCFFVFFTSSFSLDVGTKKKKKSALHFKPVL